jgi:apolipoprotein N-acyltransferase
MPVLPGLLARRVMPLAALAGALAGLGQAPVSLPWATLLGLAAVFHLYARTERPRAAAWIGWAFGAGYFAVSLFWIVEPFFVDMARHGWMAPFALVGMAGGMALFWGGAFGVARGLWRGRWTHGLALAVCLTAAELARSYVLTGFPWALIGHVWIGWPPMQLAAWIGPHGLTFATVAAAGLLGVAMRARTVRSGLALLPFAALYGLAMWQAAQPVADAGARPVLRLVQPNAAQHLKWDPDWAQVFFDRQIEMASAPAATRPDLVILPETALPIWLENADGALKRLGAAAGAPVVLGILRSEGFRAYNSLVVIDTAGQVTDLYDKYHLVPFGEYLPFQPVMSRIGLGAFTAQGGYGFSAGPGARVLALGGLGRALPLICYEAIFPQDIRAAPDRPDWLLQITNDAWFGRISGPYQHLAQARLRAAESGLPMVRVANTGVSAVIDARGRVLDSLPLDQAGFLDVTLPTALPATLFARTGDLPVALLLFAALGVLATRRVRKID